MTIPSPEQSSVNNPETESDQTHESTDEEVEHQLEGLSERDQEIATRLLAKLEQLRSFEPSNDIHKDFNILLEITGKDTLYKKVTAEDEAAIVLAGLSAIRNAWQKILKDPVNVDANNLAKKLFYIDVPNEEIVTVNKAINYYIEQFSQRIQINQEDTKTEDDDWENETNQLLE